jgi:chloride channel 3/4/5
VADHEEEEVHFHTTYSHNLDATSTSSLMEDLANPIQNPFDFSIYMDQVWKPFRRLTLAHRWQAPLTIQSNSPLEMVQQFFVKLGARYVIVTDPDGLCTSFPGIFL